MAERRTVKAGEFVGHLDPPREGQLLHAQPQFNRGGILPRGMQVWRNDTGQRIEVEDSRADDGA